MDRAKLYRLGRQPHDPAVIARMPTLAGHPLASMPVEPTLNRDNVNFWPGLYGNDTIGDCSAVGLANAARAQAALSGFDIPMPQPKVIGFYSASTGYNPADPSTDQGGRLADVLAFQLRNGFDHGGQDLLAGDFATFNPTDLDTHRRVMAQCGTGYLGVRLLEADKSADVWDAERPPQPSDPVWGDHCMLSFAYTATGETDLVTGITWGMRQPFTWRWLRFRCEEAHVVYWRQLLSPDGVNFAGLDLDKLRADGQLFASTLAQE